MQEVLSRRAMLGLIGLTSLAPLVRGLVLKEPLADAIAVISEYHGSELSLRLADEGKDWVPGNELTLSLRFRASSPEVTGELAALRDSVSKTTLFVLNLQQVDGKPQLQFSLLTNKNDVPLRVGVPRALIGTVRWHQVIVRYAGPKLDLFVDGVLMDEEWPMGALSSEGPVVLEIGSSAYSGEIANAALWKRKLSDAEVASLSGGVEQIALHTKEYLGASSNHLQYWKPQGWNTSAGDAMPMFDGERFHVYYLFDRRHHKSKWGLGAHQWGHVSSTDLIHWKQYPMALPITDESEGSICTGSVFCDQGKYYAFYATRKPDRSEQLGVALSDDGIHFAKVLPTPFREPEHPYRHGPNRDPFVFFDKPSGIYKMLVTAELDSPPLYHRGGALELLESPDLKRWEARKTFLTPGYVGAQPECSDLFQWNGWHYLSFGQDGATRYRMSRSADGPWLTPDEDLLDDPQARVMKTAEFKGNRRLAVGFVAEEGFGGHLIFRELVQNRDGSLGTKFPKEMTPALGHPIAHQAEALTPGSVLPDPTQKNGPIVVRAEDGFAVIALNEIPQNIWLSLVLQPSATTTAFGVALRGKGNYEDGVELRLNPSLRMASWNPTTAKSLDQDPLATIHQVAGLGGRVHLEIVASGSIFDVCINEQRTAIHRALGKTGDRLFLFAANGEVIAESLQIRPLV